MANIDWHDFAIVATIEFPKAAAMTGAVAVVGRATLGTAAISAASDAGAGGNNHIDDDDDDDDDMDQGSGSDDGGDDDMDQGSDSDDDNSTRDMWCRKTTLLKSQAASRRRCRW